MGFYRIFATRDTWITDAASLNDLSVRGTGSNHGASPALNVFARKGEISSASIELARTLVQFNLTELSGKIYSERTIPSSSVSYYLKMYDMGHDDTVPTSFDVFAYPLSRSWDEGRGIDDDNMRDWGYASWMEATSTQNWTTSGSDFITNLGSGSQHLDLGNEDLEIDITHIVRNWLTGTFPNNGLVIKMGSSEESNGTSYYKKLLHGRESKYIDRLPRIEARWDSVLKDNRNNFAFDVDNKLFMYKFVRGELANVREPVTVRIQDHVIGVSASFSQSYSAYQITDGILTASIYISSSQVFSGTTFYDIWSSGSTVHMTGTFTPLRLTGSTADSYNEFSVNVNNLKRVYSVSEEARVKVNVRDRDYRTHRGVISTSSLAMPKEYIEKMYYSVVNEETGETVVPFGTGTIPYTQLSYDSEGNYFTISLASFVPGFVYRLLFLIDINREDKKLIDDDFIFKVV